MKASGKVNPEKKLYLKTDFKFYKQFYFSTFQQGLPFYFY